MSRYQNNYLKNVILRIDFINPIVILSDKIPSEISAIALKSFPIYEPVEFIGSNFQIDVEGGKIENHEQKITEWNFYGKNREKRLSISSRSLFIDFSKYISFVDFISHFKPIIEQLFQMHSDIQISRIGLRYIDNINIQEKEPLNWKKYINKHLTAGFEATIDKGNISRLLHLLELSYDDFNVRFQYGMHNPDYPAVIKQKIFIIDTDIYTQGIISLDEMVITLPKMHEKAKELFENSITDALRKKMGVED